MKLMRPGSRAAYFTASAMASRRLQLAARFFERHRRQRRAASASARGTGRTAFAKALDGPKGRESHRADTPKIWELTKKITLTTSGGAAKSV